MSQPLYCSAADVGRERKPTVMAPPLTHDLAVSPFFRGCLAFLHWHFPPQSPPSRPLSPSLHSQQWDCSTILTLHTPDAAPSWVPAFLLVYVSCGKDCLILLPFRLLQINCFTLRLICFSSAPDNCPRCGDWTPASVSLPAEGRSSPTNTPVFPPSSFVLPSFAWSYIFFSCGQVLLPALSWCSASTSVSEGEFLMYLWREMYSTATYSSAILASLFSGASLEYICPANEPMKPKL